MASFHLFGVYNVVVFLTLCTCSCSGGEWLTDSKSWTNKMNLKLLSTLIQEKRNIVYILLAPTQMNGSHDFELFQIVCVVTFASIWMYFSSGNTSFLCVCCHCRHRFNLFHSIRTFCPISISILWWIISTLQLHSPYGQQSCKSWSTAQSAKKHVTNENELNRCLYFERKYGRRSFFGV